jgi:two-component system OmpR family sensor kinase
VLDRNPFVDPAQIREEHALVLDELDRMNRLVGDLLTLARASREDHLRREPIALDAFLGTLIEQGPHLADREWHSDEFPGGTVRADQDGLTQVLLNLMQNGVAHTQPGQLVALGGSRSKDLVRLWVRDTGQGMDSETLERVFEPFFSGPSPAGGRSGLGLGLAIVKAIVAAHGGWVEVESQMEKGSRFTIVLPS